MYPPSTTSRHIVDGDSFDRVVGEAAGRLSDGLHVWRFDLRSVINCDLDICSNAERRRARSFASISDGMAFLRFRALTRRVLAAYSGISACDIELSSSENKAPQVLGCSLQFNISHSDRQLAVAVRSAGLVGVDIQQMRPTQDLGLARSVFALSEWRLLAGLPLREREVEFYRIWVCREAVLKAVGTGFRSDGLALRRGIDGQYAIAEHPSGWTEIKIREFAGPEGFIGAVAWSDTGGTIEISHHIVSDQWQPQSV